MFFVINRDKIYAYCVSILTVILLFCVANVMTSKNGDNVVMTSSGNKELPIYSVETNEKKVSLTINSAWNDSDIDKILEVFILSSIFSALISSSVLEEYILFILSLVSVLGLTALYIPCKSFLVISLLNILSASSSVFSEEYLSILSRITKLFTLTLLSLISSTSNPFFF